MAQTIKNPPAMWETWVLSLGLENPLGKGFFFSPVFLPGDFHGQRSLTGATVHGIAKNQTQLSDFHLISLHRNIRDWNLQAYIKHWSRGDEVKTVKKQRDLEQINK